MNIDGAVPLADLIQNMIKTPQALQLMQHKDMQQQQGTGGFRANPGSESDPIKSVLQFSDDNFGTALQPQYTDAINGINSALSDASNAVMYALTPASTATASELGATGTVGGASTTLGGTAGATAGEATAAAAGTTEAVVGTEGAAATAASTEAGSSWLSSEN